MAARLRIITRCRLALPLLALMASLASASSAFALGLAAELAWEYPTEAPGEEAVGFMIYRGVGPECERLDPLTNRVGAIVRDSLSFIDQDSGAEQGPLCYEVTAFNAAGESPHSERASVQAETLRPAAPSGVQVNILIE